MDEKTASSSCHKRSRIDAFSDLEKKVSQKRQDDSVKLNVKSSYIGSKIFEAKYISKSFGKYKLLDNFYYNFSRYEKMGIIDMRRALL